jgi:hypothetical protein
MNDTPLPHPDPGRWIRAALVILPVGTILLGIASFGIWQWQRDRAADRSFKYAQALRHEISAPAMERHAAVIRTALGQADALLAIPGYLESTMGAENMGYNVRRMRYANFANVDAELSGKQMPRQVVLVLLPYSTDPIMREQIALSLAMMLGTAHDITGQPTLRTVRFAAVPVVEDAVEKLAAQMRHEDEHLMHLLILARPDEALKKRVETALGTVAAGTRVESISATDLVTQAQQLKATLLQSAGQP